MFEIKHVEFENPFYRLGKELYLRTPVYELYRYEDEYTDTGVALIDETVMAEGETTTVILAGIGSTALATVDSFAGQGALQQIFLNDDGYGYTSAPSVTVSLSCWCYFLQSNCLLHLPRNDQVSFLLIK